MLETKDLEMITEAMTRVVEPLRDDLAEIRTEVKNGSSGAAG